MLITDIAPIDLLLQRIGRLHRHQRGEGQNDRPSKLRSARCLITGVSNWDASPPELAKGVSSVYQPALLWETLLALYSDNHDGIISIDLPTDIPLLVEKVYQREETIPSAWSEGVATAELRMEDCRASKKERAESWLLGKVPRNGQDFTGRFRAAVRADDERTGRAVVRDTKESIDVVVVKEVNGELYLLSWIVDKGQNYSLGDGFEAPNDDLARLAARCTVSLPPSLTYPSIIDQVIHSLETVRPVPGWQESRWLRGELSLVLDNDNRAVIAIDNSVYELQYSRTIGLV